MSKKNNSRLRIGTKEFASFYRFSKLSHIAIFMLLKVDSFQVILNNFINNKPFSIVCFFIVRDQEAITMS